MTKKYKIVKILLVLCLIVSAVFAGGAAAFAAPVNDCGAKTCTVTCNDGTQVQVAATKSGSSIVYKPTLADACQGHGSATSISNPQQSKYYCGGGNQQVQVSLYLGCKQEGNPIMDVSFAIIRFLSDGVGLVIIGSIVVGGIQYSASRGDPQATAIAINRLRSTIIALLIFIFGYALLNYIIPAGFLH